MWKGYADSIVIRWSSQASQDKLCYDVLQLPNERGPCHPKTIPNLRQRNSRRREDPPAKIMRPAGDIPQGYKPAKARQISDRSASLLPAATHQPQRFLRPEYSGIRAIRLESTGSCVDVPAQCAWTICLDAQIHCCCEDTQHWLPIAWRFGVGLYGIFQRVAALQENGLESVQTASHPNDWTLLSNR